MEPSRTQLSQTLAEQIRLAEETAQQAMELLSSVSEERDQLLTQLRQRSSQHNAVEQNQARSTEELEAANIARDVFQDRLAAAEADRAEIKLAFDQLRLAHEELQANHDTHVAEQQEQNERSRVAEAQQNALVDLQSELESAQLQAAAAQASCTAMQLQQAELNRQHEAALAAQVQKSEKAAAEQKVAAADEHQAQLDKCLEELDELKQHICNVEGRLEQEQDLSAEKVATAQHELISQHAEQLDKHKLAAQQTREELRKLQDIHSQLQTEHAMLGRQKQEALFDHQQALIAAAEQQAQLASQLEQARTAYSQLQDVHTDLKAQHEAIWNDQQHLDSDHQQRLVALRTQLATSESCQQALRAKLDAAEKALEQHSQEARTSASVRLELEDELKESRRLQSELHGQLEDAAEGRAQMLKQLDEAAKLQDSTGSSKAVAVRVRDQYKVQLEALTQEQDQIKAEHAAAVRAQEASRHDMHQAEAAKLDMEKQVQEATAASSEAAAARDDMASKLSFVQKQLETLQAQHADVTTRMEAIVQSSSNDTVAAIQASQKLERVRGRLHESIIELEQRKNQQVAVDKQLSEANRDSGIARLRCSEAEGALDRLQQEMQQQTLAGSAATEQLQLQLQETMRELQDSQHQLKQVSKAEADLQERLAFAGTDRERAQQQTADSQTSLDGCRADLKSKTAECNDLADQLRQGQERSAAQMRSIAQAQSQVSYKPDCSSCHCHFLLGCSCSG